MICETIVNNRGCNIRTIGFDGSRLSETSEFRAKRGIEEVMRQDGVAVQARCLKTLREVGTFTHFFGLSTKHSTQNVCHIRQVCI